MDKKKFKLLSEELKFASSMLPTYPEESNSYRDTPIYLADGLGEGKPVFTEDRICFNGVDKDGMGHETFILDQKNGAAPRKNKGLIFCFCKTANKPYDLMVCISLLRLKHHFPESEITSDGDMRDWAFAVQNYKNIFQENPPLMENITFKIQYTKANTIA